MNTQHVGKLLALGVVLALTVPVVFAGQGGLNQTGLDGSPGPSVAQSMGGGNARQFLSPQAKESRRRQMMQQMGLTPDQMAKIKAIRKQNKPQADALHQQIQAKRQAMMDYMSSPNADESKARAMQQELRGLQHQVEDLRMKSWFEMKKNLSPDQIQRFEQARQQMRQYHSETAGGRGGYGNNNTDNAGQSPYGTGSMGFSQGNNGPQGFRRGLGNGAGGGGKRGNPYGL